MTDSIPRGIKPANLNPGTFVSARLRRIAGVSGLIFSILAIACFAQSPAQGPPTTDHPGPPEVGIGMLVGIVKTVAQKSVDTTNATLKSQGHDTRLKLMPLKFTGPSRMATQDTNRPNQFYAWLPVTIELEVQIPHWFNRTVFITIDVNVFCEGWHSKNGNIRIEARPGPPSFEGGRWVENAPGLAFVKAKIDSIIRSSFRENQPVFTNMVLRDFKCGTLGITQVQGANDRFAAVLFDPPARGTIHPALESLEVKFLRLKRLVAQDLGRVLYDPVENIVLETYTDYVHRGSAILTMRENDEVVLKLAPVILEAPLLDPLVIIANINQQSQSHKQDSDFAIWARSMNYSPGTHKLIIRKSYFVPPGPGNPKPFKTWIAAYELTYSVAYRKQPGSVSTAP